MVVKTEVMVFCFVAVWSDIFPIQNGLKLGDALLPLLFNYALKCTIRKVKKKFSLLFDPSDIES